MINGFLNLTKKYSVLYMNKFAVKSITDRISLKLDHLRIVHKFSSILV